MDTVVKVSVLALIGCLLCLIIKKDLPELSLLLGVAVCISIFYLSASALSGLLDFLSSLAASAGISAALTAPVVKSLGVALTCKFAADSCRDAQQSAIAGAVETAGTLACLYISLPLMQTVFRMISSLL